MKRDVTEVLDSKRENAKTSESARGTEISRDPAAPSQVLPLGFRAFARFRSFALPSGAFSHRETGRQCKGIT